MRRFLYLILTLVLSLGMAGVSAAQSAADPSVGPAMDSTLVGKNIFNLMPNVSVHQSQAIVSSLNSQIASNSSRKVSGFRVRIFNDNKQNSRGASEAAMARFKGMFPGVAAYRTYSNPFFKVTVGDFRTKSEAMQLLQSLKGSFPSAFIVKETINYPPVNSIY